MCYAAVMEFWRNRISLRYSLELIHVTLNCLGLAQQLCHFQCDERPALKRKILLLWQIDHLTHCWEMPQAVTGSAARELIASRLAYLVLLVLYEKMVKPLWQGSFTFWACKIQEYTEFLRTIICSPTSVASHLVDIIIHSSKKHRFQIQLYSYIDIPQSKNTFFSFTAFLVTFHMKEIKLLP